MQPRSYGSFGWRELNQNREDILSAYDRARALADRRPVKTAHGNTVEASIRGWLQDYLPKKYGVTSGYIIPDVFELDYTLRHFDIIIYNQLESPVLWVEQNLDESEQGKSRAIPAKHVMAVYEVKSSLDLQAARASIEKLSEINVFRDHLPANFSAGSIFVELRSDNVPRRKAMQELFKGKDVHGYWGGVIFRCEVDISMTGFIQMANSPDGSDGFSPDLEYLARPIDELAIFLQEDGTLTLQEAGASATLIATDCSTWRVIKCFSIGYGEGSESIILNWSRNGFSDFALQLLATLDGIQHNADNRPRYGIVFDQVDLKEASPQPDDPIEGQPYIEVTACCLPGTHEYIAIDQLEGRIRLKICYAVRNSGRESAEISHDGFKTSTILLPGHVNILESPLELGSAPGVVPSPEAVREFVNSGEDVLRMTLRLVYRSPHLKNKFYKVENGYSFSARAATKLANPATCSPGLTKRFLDAVVSSSP